MQVDIRWLLHPSPLAVFLQSMEAEGQWVACPLFRKGCSAYAAPCIPEPHGRAESVAFSRHVALFLVAVHTGQTLLRKLTAKAV